MATHRHPLPVRFIDLMQSNSPVLRSFLLLHWQLKNYWDLLQKFISCEVIQKMLFSPPRTELSLLGHLFAILPFPPSGSFFFCHFMFVKYAFDFLRCTFSLIFQLAATSHKGMWSSRSANITYTQCCGLLVFFSLQISCFPCHPTKCAIIYSFHVLLVVSKWGSSLEGPL